LNFSEAKTFQERTTTTDVVSKRRRDLLEKEKEKTKNLSATEMKDAALSGA